MTLIPGAEFRITGSSFANPPVSGVQRIPVNSTNGTDTLYGRFVAEVEYTILEITPPEGYISAAPVIFMFNELGYIRYKTNGNWSAYGTSSSPSMDIRNAKTDITIQKKDQYGDRVSGADLKITGEFADSQYNAGGYIWTTESSDDKVLTALLIVGNTYTLTETALPSNGQYLQASPITFKVSPDGTLIIDNTVTDKKVITMLDTRALAQVSIEKTDSADSSSKLGGIVYSLYKVTGNGDKLIASDLVTDDNGQWSTVGSALTNPDTDKPLKLGLTEGSYYFIETATKNNYYLDTDPLTFDITAGDYNKVSNKNYTNEKINVAMRLYKLDPQNEADSRGIDNTEYELSWIPEGETAAEGQTLRSGLSGMIFKDQLIKGSYTLTETEANVNYELGATPFTCTFVVTDAAHNKTLTINSDPANTEAVTVFNLNITAGSDMLDAGGLKNDRKTGEVTLKKVYFDGDTETPINGATFILFIDDGSGNYTKAGEAITGDDGMLKIDRPAVG